MPDKQPPAKTLVINGDKDMAELFRANGILPPPHGAIVMIISGDCLADYTPWPAKALRSDFKNFEGRADDYLEWMEKSLLPALNNTYNIRLDAPFTELMGQSLGGLLTLYAQTRPLGKCFGAAVCVSPSVWYQDFFEYFNAQIQYLPTKHWVFACGRNEGRGHNDIKQNVVPYNMEIIRKLMDAQGEKRVATYWDSDTHHQNLPGRYRWAVKSFFALKDEQLS